jgi:hypothetical protein
MAPKAKIDLKSSITDRSECGASPSWLDCNYLVSANMQDCTQAIVKLTSVGGKGRAVLCGTLNSVSCCRIWGQQVLGKTYLAAHMYAGYEAG